jgi:hypothetical protein
MTKILYVYGGDYSALDFEKLRDANVVDPAELWYIANLDGHQEYETENEYFEYEAYEFEAIDPKFIEFIQVNQDHDDSKNTNFYVVD